MLESFEKHDIKTPHQWIICLPIGVKFLYLFLLSLFLFFFSYFYTIILTFLLALVIYPLAGLPLLLPLKNLLKLWWLFAALFLVQWMTIPWHDSLAITLRLASLLLIANLINATTKASDMLSAFERFFRFLKPIGINPGKVALALSLTLRFVPVIKIITDEIRQAQKARGLERSFLALFIPLLIRIVKMGDDIAQAILARDFDME